MAGFGPRASARRVIHQHQNAASVRRASLVARRRSVSRNRSPDGGLVHIPIHRRRETPIKLESGTSTGAKGFISDKRKIDLHCSSYSRRISARPDSGSSACACSAIPPESLLKGRANRSPRAGVLPMRSHPIHPQPMRVHFRFVVIEATSPMQERTSTCSTISILLYFLSCQSK